MISFKNNQMLTQAHKARFQPKPLLQILLFAAIFLVGNIISSVILIIGIVISIFADPAALSAILSGDTGAATLATEAIMAQPWITLLSLFVTGITTLLCIFYCCVLEKRPLSSMGLGKKAWLSQYLKGYAIGLGMLFLCALLLWL